MGGRSEKEQAFSEGGGTSQKPKGLLRSFHSLLRGQREPLRSPGGFSEASEGPPPLISPPRPPPRGGVREAREDGHTRRRRHRGGSLRRRGRGRWRVGGGTSGTAVPGADGAGGWWERADYEICCVQLVSAPPPGAFLDTRAPPRAGRRRENQLRELILYSTLCYSTLSSAPTMAWATEAAPKQSLLAPP